MTAGTEDGAGAATTLLNRPHRLHPLSIPYRIAEQGVAVVFLAIVVGPALVGLVTDAVGEGGALGLGLLVVATGAGYAVAAYRRFEYELTPATFDIRSGVFARRDREIPLRRIQNVDISQNVVQRLLGLAELRLETAGASGSEAHLQYVGEERADSLQREISRLRGAGDAEPTDGDAFETVFEISPKELGLLALVSADLRLFSILALGASVVAPSVAPMAEQWLAVGVESVVRGLFGTAATLAFLVVVGLLYGVVNATLYYGFTLHRAPEELRYERGLFQRYSGTVPLGKVQSLTVGENVLARALGYASLDIETAGGSGREQDQNNSQSAVPLASRERVFELTNSIEAVGDVAFERPPTRARERYAVRYSGVVLAVTALLFLIQTAFSSSLFWWAPLGLLAVVPVAAHLKWKQRGVFVGPNHVVTRNGFWVRKTKIVPYYRVQTVLSSETVFQRRRRLGTVTVDTAGARSLLGDDATAVDIDAERTEELRERVANELYAALRRPGGPAQSDGRTDGPATGEGRSLDG
jgi:putative membrane protein